jgi:hypothetical protein
MKWVHYTDSPAPIELVNREQENEKFSPYGKPSGLWITPEGIDQNWYDWCMAEEFRTEQLAYTHEVIIKPESKLLTINSDKDLRDFTEKYAISDDAYIPFFDLIGGKPIDWVRVATEYQGILIPEYIGTCRMSRKTSWYYGWDCGSGCIWDASAISIGQVYLTPQKESADV